MHNQESINNLKLLSLDGGGVCALSALIVLQEFMRRVQAQCKTQIQLRPCEWFDMIAGTGTGGLIAILLGRLSMSVDEAIESYQLIMKKAFSEKKKKVASETMFKASNLESAINEAIATHMTGDTNPMMLNTSASGCKTFVCTMLAENMTGGAPTLIRSYEVVENEGPRCTIKEAVRATTATPGLFKPISIVNGGCKLSYIDAGLGNNNPIACMLPEVEQVFPGRKVSSIISIGSGHLQPIGISQYPSAVLLGMNVATDCERVAQEMARRFQNTTDLYFRFNVEQGLQHIQPTSSDQMPNIIAQARHYVRTVETKEKLARAIGSASTNSSTISTSHLSGMAVVAENIQPLRECPLPSPVFTGRTEILTQMHNSIFDKSYSRHVFILHGLGGSGKTQLALKFVDLHKKRFSDVFYIDATSATTIEAGLKQISLAKSIGNTFNDTITWLAGRCENWLVIYNNADDATLNIRSYFPPCSHGNILITSRNKNVVMHAQDPRAHCQVAGMLPTDAQQLLLNLSQAPMASQNKDIAEALVKELGYLALAVVHAGAYVCVHKCTLADYLILYQENRLKLLEEYRTLVQKVDDYEETIYTTWRVSYQRLKPDTVLLLQLLAFMHHEGVLEELFRRANIEIANSEFASHEMVLEVASDQVLANLMRRFRTESGGWHRLEFLNTINDAHSYSLIDFDATNGVYSMHSLVHSWIRTTVDDTEVMSNRAMALLALSISKDYSFQDIKFRTMILPHVDAFHPDLGCRPEWARKFSLVYYEAGRWQLASVLQNLVVEDDKLLLGDNDLTTLADIHELAMMHQANGRYRDAEALHNQVVVARTNRLGESHPDTIRALAYLSTTYQCQGRYEEAEAIQLKVLDAAKRMLGPEARETLMATQILAQTYSCQGRLLESINLENSILDVECRTLGLCHPTTLKTLLSLGGLCTDIGETKLAELLVRHYLAFHTRIFGKNHPNTLDGVRLLGKIYLGQGRTQEAEILFFHTLKILQRSLGNNHVFTLGTLADMGCIHLINGRVSEAETIHQQVHKASVEVLGKYHRNTLSNVNNLSVAYLMQDRFAKAEDMLVEEIMLQTGCYSADRDAGGIAHLLYNLARVYARQARWKDAKIVEEHAVEFHTVCFGGEHPTTMLFSRFLAEIEWELRKAMYLRLLYRAAALFVLAISLIVSRW